MPARPITRLILLALVCTACAPLARASQGADAPSKDEPSPSSLLSKLPLSFIENRGQISNEEVAHYAQTPSGAIGFTSTGLRIGLSDTQGTNQQWSLAMDFLGARAQPVAGDLQEGVVSYFTGDRKDWHTNLPTHSRITYPDLWEGIDLVYRADGPKLKYEFVVHPGADPDDIRLRWRGARDVAQLQDGSLRVQTPAGSLTDGAPVSFQDGRSIETSYELDDTKVGFSLGAHDPTRTLVIDPVLTLYAGYIGGTGDDIGNGIAVDPSGAAYVTGYTDSTAATFPETVGPDLIHNGSLDAFVAKVNPAGTALVYAGYIGGTGNDIGRGIAVDPSGAAYVTGHTASDATSFPETVGPDLIHNGGIDAFVAKVNPAGTALVYAGYIGGTGNDQAYGIALDPSGAAYVTGQTDSTAATFPETVGPFLNKLAGNDAFVAKVNPGGTALVYAGYIGGAGEDYGQGIAVDPSGAAYVTGFTDSDEATFPVNLGFDPSHNGGNDAFVAKVNPGGTALTYAGYIGGTGTDAGNGIAVDPSGAAYVTGQTDSTATTFPETVGPDLSYNGGAFDAFVAKLNPGGTALINAGYIGGDGIDIGGGVAVDPSGAAYVTGLTASTATTFPDTVGPDLSYNGGGDAFVAKVNPGGAALVYAGYIGGNQGDTGNGIAVDPSGAAYVTGNTSSGATTFPDTVGPDLSYNGGDFDGFVAKLTDNLCRGRGVTIQGTADDNTIVGTPDDDVIKGLGGNDRIRGGGGNDTICGGEGKDRLSGGRGKDRLFGERGKDRLFGGRGKDRLSGGRGKDRLLGKRGKDRLFGGRANDRLSGGRGNDRLNGGAGGNDRCRGGQGTGDTATKCETVTGVP